jgi:filamentous hemagglutinin family protein
MVHTRKPLAILLAWALLVYPLPRVLADLPSNAKVLSGTADVSTDGNTMTVTTSDKAVIHWDTFNVGQGSTIRFVQPSTSSMVVNRVLGGQQSVIAGLISANGKLVLINRAGIHVTATGQIQAANFIASTLANISDQQILTGGDMHFVGESSAPIANDGNIEAIGGDVFLIAQRITNTGAITAPDGKVGLAAGNDVLLSHDGQLFVGHSINVPEGSIGIDQKGIIEAAQAELKTKDGNLYALAINSEGVVRATGLDETEDGRIVLRAESGTVRAGGHLAATTVNDAGTEIGGRIEITGDEVIVPEGASIDASGQLGGGEVYIGGEFQGTGDLPHADYLLAESGATLSADALVEGDGGVIVLWSDLVTLYAASASARGGARGGDGGLIEVSSAGDLAYAGSADTTATAGTTGTLLLDPRDTIIGAGGLYWTSDVDFGTWGNNSNRTITPAGIVDGLATSNIVIKTNRDLTVQDAIVSPHPNDLSLIAGRRLFINDNITLQGGNFEGVANASGANAFWRGSGDGYLRMAPATAIATNGGNITLRYENGPGIVGRGVDDMVLYNLHAGGGNILVDTQVNILKNANIQSHGSLNGAMVELFGRDVNLLGDTTATAGLNVGATDDIDINNVTGLTGPQAYTADDRISVLGTINGASATFTTAAGLGTERLFEVRNGGSVDVAGPVSILTHYFSLNNTGLLSNAAGDITVTARPGVSVYVGGTGVLSMNLSQDDLSRISTPGRLVVRGQYLSPRFPANMFVEGMAGAAPQALGGVVLEGGNDVTFQNGPVNFATGLDVTSGGMTYLDADVSTNGSAMIFQSPTELLDDVHLAATNLTFANTVDGPWDLTVVDHGTTWFQQKVGDGGALNNLSATAGSILLAGGPGKFVRTDGAQTYNGHVLLGGYTELFSKGDVTFLGLLDSAAGTSRNMKVKAGGNTVAFHQEVGGTDPLGYLEVQGGAITFAHKAHVTTNKTQTYKGAVLGGGYVVLKTDADRTGDGGVTFEDRVDSFSGSKNFNLRISANGNDVDFQADAGSVDQLFGLRVHQADTLNLHDVTTWKYQRYEANTINLASTWTAGMDVLVNGNLLLLNTATINGTDVTFTGSVNSDTSGPKGLTVNGSGTTIFQGPVGNANPLGWLTSAGGGTTEFHGGTVHTAWGQFYVDDVILGSDAVLTNLANSGINFWNTINGNHHLTVSDPAQVKFLGQVGNVNPLASLLVTGGGTTLLDITRNTPPTQSILVDGLLRLENPVTLGQYTELQGGQVDLVGGIDGPRKLQVKSYGGLINLFGSVGQTDPLSVLSLNTGPSGLINIADGAAVRVTTTGSQTYNGPVALNYYTELKGGPIVFKSTVDSPSGRNLRIKAQGTDVTFQDNVGGTDPLGYLAVMNADTLNLHDVTTNSFQDYNANTINVSSTWLADIGDITVNGALWLGDDAFITSTGGKIVFNGTVDSATPGAYSLATDSAGQTEFLGQVGDGGALNNLSATAGSILLAGGPGKFVRTDGAQTYNGHVLLGGYTELFSKGDVTFLGLLDSAAGTSRNMKVKAGGNTVAFHQEVGGTDPLGYLEVQGGAITFAHKAHVTTNKTQTYKGAVLGGGYVVLKTDADRTGDGGVTFEDRVDSFSGSKNFNLRISANGNDVDFQADAGSVDQLFGLRVHQADTLNLHDVTTWKYQRYEANTINLASTWTAGMDVLVNGNLLLLNTATINGTDVTFTGSVNSDTSGPKGLTVNGSGTTIFQGPVGNANPLGWLTSAGGGTTEFHGGTVHTAWGQFYVDDVILGSDAVLTNLANSGINFWNTINGNHHLTVSDPAQVKFLGQVGNVNPLASLLVTGGGTTLLDITRNTPPTQSILVDGLLRLENPVTLGQYTELQGGQVDLVGGIDGPRKLQVKSYGGLINLFGSVGQTDPLSVLSLNTGPSGLINIADGAAVRVTTTGSQTYNGPVALNYYTELKGGPIVFKSTVDSPSGRNLRIKAQGTDVTFQDNVGGTDPLGYLAVMNADTLNLHDVTTNSFQDYNANTINLASTLWAGSDITVGGNLVLLSDGSVIGDGVTFAGSVNGDGNGPWALDVTDTGLSSFLGQVGNVNPLRTLDVTARNIHLNDVTTTDWQSYHTLFAWTQMFGTLSAGSSVSLRADFGTTVEQFAGAQILAETLVLIGSGVMDLTQPGNDVNAVLMDAVGPSAVFTYLDANDVTSGTLDGVHGLMVRNGARIDLRTPNGQILLPGLFNGTPISRFQMLGQGRVYEEPVPGSGQWEILLLATAGQPSPQGEIEAFTGLPAGTLDSFAPQPQVGSAIMVDANVPADLPLFSYSQNLLTTDTASGGYAFVTFLASASESANVSQALLPYPGGTQTGFIRQGVLTAGGPVQIGIGVMTPSFEQEQPNGNGDFPRGDFSSQGVSGPYFGPGRVTFPGEFGFEPETAIILRGFELRPQPPIEQIAQAILGIDVGDELARTQNYYLWNFTSIAPNLPAPGEIPADQALAGLLNALNLYFDQYLQGFSGELTLLTAIEQPNADFYRR